MTSATQRVYLHIGLPKTGTTSLQELLWHNQDALTSAGVSFPGYDLGAHHRAVADVHPGRYGGWKEKRTPGSWNWLVEQARAFDGATLISSELLAPASPEEAEQVVCSLSFAEVHIVCTVRDLARQIPSVWQENVKTRQSTSYPDLLASLRSGELDDTARLFWDYQDLPRVLETWGAGIPADRVHVVTVPPRGGRPDVLWERFAGLLGLDPTAYETDIPHYGNFSLGYPETEFLRRINASLPDRFPWLQYARRVKDDFAAHTLSGRSGRGSIPLPKQDQDWVRETAERYIEQVRDAGYHVVGDLEDLRPAAPRGDEPATADDLTPSEAEIGEIAMESVTDLLRHPAGSRRMMKRKPPQQAKALRLRQFVMRMSDQYPQVMAARRAYWRARAKLGR